MPAVGAPPAKIAEIADGRVQRGARSRKRIVEALYELLHEGHLRPTAEQVAERAGVGTRTVFRHFDDMEGLHAEVNARIIEIEAPLVGSPDPSGPLAERVAAMVEQRAAFYERITPFKRSDAVHRWRSPFLQRTHAEMVRRLRADLCAWLPEFQSRPGWLADAADLLTSFESWDRLRRDQRLGRDRAQEAVRRALLALLREN